MSNLPFPDDDGQESEPPPYRPTPEDLAEYAAWSAQLHSRDEPFCPADFGHYCEDCDREMAEALARERDAMTDGWYKELCMRAESPGPGPHHGWRD